MRESGEIRVSDGGTEGEREMSYLRSCADSLLCGFSKRYGLLD